METSLCQRGVAQRALKHLASGGQGKEHPLPLWAPIPVRHIPSWVMWGQQERSRGFRWILVEDSVGGLGKGAILQSSVIPLALSSSCTLVR